MSEHMAESELLEKVQALLPLVAEQAEKADRNGQPSDALIDAFRDAGMFALLAPRRFGGLELGLKTFSRAIQMISAVSPSAGWIISFLAGASWRLLIFGEEGQDELYGDRNYIMGAGTAAPLSDVRKVDGGYRLTGRTAWNSGSSHADWIQANGIVPAEDGPPELFMFAMPKNDVAIIDNWNILGMKATASRDVVFDGVFVPDRRSARFGPALEGRSAGHRLHDNPLYRIPFLLFAMTEVAPVLVGAHRGAARVLERRVRSRQGTISGSQARQNVPQQIRMARALARAEMAEQMLDAMIADIESARPDAAEPLNRSRIKLHASMITDFCLDSVNEMARGMGGDGLRDEAPFQPYFRDINTVARHAFLDPETAAESFGKLTLGLPITDPLI